MTERDEDFEWMRRAQAGDDAAFEALMRRYARPVLNFIHRIAGDATAAEDLAQEVFVRAYRALPAFKPSSAAVSTWLFRIARNLALDHLRHRARRPEESLEDCGETPEAPGASPVRALEQRELGEAIARAVAELPEDQRAALVLAEYHGQSMREIAGVLGCSEKSVESRLYRARQFLRQRLADTR